MIHAAEQPLDLNSSDPTVPEGNGRSDTIDEADLGPLRTAAPAKSDDADYFALVRSVTRSPPDAIDAVLTMPASPMGLFLARAFHRRDWQAMLLSGGDREAVAHELGAAPLAALVREAFLRDFDAILIAACMLDPQAVDAGLRTSRMPRMRKATFRSVCDWLHRPAINADEQRLREQLIERFGQRPSTRSALSELRDGFYCLVDDVTAWGDVSQKSAHEDVTRLLKMRNKGVFDTRVRQLRRKRRERGGTVASRRATAGAFAVQALRKTLVRKRLRCRFEGLLPPPQSVQALLLLKPSPTTQTAGRPLRKERRIERHPDAVKRILPDEVWADIAAVFVDDGGRPKRVADRSVLGVVLLLLESGAQWRSIPTSLGVGFATARRRLEEWRRNGIWRPVVEILRSIPAYKDFDFERMDALRQL